MVFAFDNGSDDDTHRMFATDPDDHAVVLPQIRNILISVSFLVCLSSLYPPKRKYLFINGWKHGNALEALRNFEWYRSCEKKRRGSRGGGFQSQQTSPL
mmetsp:Transcript_105806/g.215762  ORF Transcript_105806/g.215762 Transcript_105806/m.215762 type:complete len:99 (+) Transcript_105806:2966-3262(+)